MPRAAELQKQNVPITGVYPALSIAGKAPTQVNRAIWGGPHSNHDAIYNTFNVERLLITRKTIRQFRGEAMNTWRTVTAAA